jgi:hypothetical protein
MAEFPFPGPLPYRPFRPSPQMFVGCMSCRVVDIRRDVVAQRQQCAGPSGQLRIRYRCDVCGWDQWCDGPVTCSVDAEHSLTALDIDRFG